LALCTGWAKIKAPANMMPKRAMDIMSCNDHRFTFRCMTERSNARTRRFLVIPICLAVLRSSNYPFLITNLKISFFDLKTSLMR
jgi:hypothetical protein